MARHPLRDADVPEGLDPGTAFLRACARIELDTGSRCRLVDAASRVQDWDLVVSRAERHGLAPLVSHYLRASSIPIPERARRQLVALVLRHRVTVSEQTEALVEIVEALHSAGIDHVVLKGAALARIIYPRPDLRPMSDLDILVAAEHAADAQVILRGLGFDAPLVHARRVLRFHHHLPMATRRRQGVLVCVEIHRDAVSPDRPCRLRLGGLSQPVREIQSSGLRLRALNHVDMLVHLFWHVLEPRKDTRLIAVADFVGYAARFADEIDWDLMRRVHRRVVNALTLMHYLTPLPESLRELRPPDAPSAPRDVGRGFPPLASLSIRGGDITSVIYPSEWWMRVCYGVAPGRSLFAVRWGRHVWALLYWLGRRAVAASMPVRRAGVPNGPSDHAVVRSLG